MIADIEELEQMDASELHARRIVAKEVLTPMEGEKFIFSVADGTVNNSGEYQDLRISTLIGDSPDRGEEQDSLPTTITKCMMPASKKEEQDSLRGESDGSSSTSGQDSWYDGEAKGDFWSICGKNKLDVCMLLCCMVSTHDEHTAMGKAGNKCQPTVYMSLHGNIANVVCCAEVLFQTSFS